MASSEWAGCEPLLKAVFLWLPSILKEGTGRPWHGRACRARDSVAQARYAHLRIWPCPFLAAPWRVLVRRFAILLCRCNSATGGASIEYVMASPHRRFAACSCEMARQRQICKHQVRYLLDCVPAPTHKLNAQKLIFAMLGPRFGSAGSCDLGSVEPLWDALSRLGQAPSEQLCAAARDGEHTSTAAAAHLEATRESESPASPGAQPLPGEAPMGEQALAIASHAIATEVHRALQALSGAAPEARRAMAEACSFHAKRMLQICAGGDIDQGEDVPVAFVLTKAAGSQARRPSCTERNRRKRGPHKASREGTRSSGGDERQAVAAASGSVAGVQGERAPGAAKAARARSPSTSTSTSGSTPREFATRAALTAAKKKRPPTQRQKTAALQERAVKNAAARTLLQQRQKRRSAQQSQQDVAAATAESAPGAATAAQPQPPSFDAGS